MPQARAAPSFDPIANTRRPKTVLRSTIAASTASSAVSQTPGATISQDAVGNVTASSLIQVAGTFTVCWSAIHFATPRATPSMPSVAMKGITFNRVMTRPLTIADQRRRRPRPPTPR